VASWLGTLQERFSPRQPDSLAPTAPAEPQRKARILAPPRPSTLPPEEPSVTTDAAASIAAAEPELIHQRLGVRQERYAPPRVLHPMASQLVGLLFTLLGPPVFTPTVPGVRHPGTEGECTRVCIMVGHHCRWPRTCGRFTAPLVVVQRRALWSDSHLISSSTSWQLQPANVLSYTGKYELLRLLWQRAERQFREGNIGSAQQQQQQQQQQPEEQWLGAEGRILDGLPAVEEDAPADAEEADWLRREAAAAAAMTAHLRESLRKVLDDPLVPQKARDVAVARLRDREATVARGLRAWFDECAARPEFGAVVLPLLRLVVGALEGAGLEAAADVRGSGGSAANGEAMEARTLALVEAQLPAGWSLLSKGHVVALDGRHPGHAARCKWEVDVVALDDSGTAVALFEVRARGPSRSGRGEVCWDQASLGVKAERAIWLCGWIFQCVDQTGSAECSLSAVVVNQHTRGHCARAPTGRDFTCVAFASRVPA
jgi:hypothetical protein